MKTSNKAHVNWIFYESSTELVGIVEITKVADIEGIHTSLEI